MSEFKVGDRVRLRHDGPGWPGDARNGTIVGFRDEWVRVDHDAPSRLGRQKDCGWHAVDLEPVARVELPDPVNHPAHYTQFPVEVIDITEHLSFNLGNVVKYACRAGRKDGADPIEDLRKMLWYGQRELERLTKDA